MKRLDIGGIFFFAALSCIMLGSGLSFITGAVTFGGYWTFPLAIIGIGILILWSLAFVIYIEEGLHETYHNHDEDEK